MSGPMGPSPAVESVMLFTEGQHEWVIKNFSVVLGAKLDKLQTVESPKMSISGHTWEAKLSGSEKDKDSKDSKDSKENKDNKDSKEKESKKECDSLSLFLYTFLRHHVSACFRMEILNGVSRRPIFEGVETAYRDFGEMGWGFKSLVSRQYLVRHEQFNETLIFVFKIKVAGDLSQTVAPKAPESTIIGDMEDLMKSGLHSDVTFHLPDETTVPAHKAILCVRSPYFKLMFEAGMKEGKEGKVVLSSETDPACFKKLLRFIYTDNCNLSGVDVPRLLALAHEYQLPRLQSLCAYHLMTTLDEKNAAERLALAHTYEQEPCCAQLMQKCVEFINGHLQEVVNSPGFEKLTETCPRLLAFVLKAKVSPPEESKKRKLPDKPKLTPEEVQKLTVAELKSELGIRGISKSGNKALLVERLLHSIAQEEE